MSQTIQISEKSAELLARQAAAHGVSVEAWLEELAIENAQAAPLERTDAKASADRSLVAQMRELRAHVKPDPEGWTIKDYIKYGRS